MGQERFKVEILRPIGAGGMATVHLARIDEIDGTSRTVAVKRLHDFIAADPQNVAILEDEARLASCIDHPNVVKVLDLVDGDGTTAPTLVMEWVEGTNLAALLVCTGPLVGAGLAMLRRSSERTVLLLAGAAAVSVLLADLSQMSKAEVERIWLPFVPWLLLVTALLPERWRRWGLLLQVVWAIAVQQLLYTSW